MTNEFLDPNKQVRLLHNGKTVAVVENPTLPKLAPPLFGYGRVDQPGAEGDSAFNAQPGVVGAHGDAGDGVLGVSTNGVGIHGRGGRLAGFFEGNVEITGNVDVTGSGCDIRLVNEDCAEDFDVLGGEKVDPGTVMVLGDAGDLVESRHAYDKRVAGVVSGGGDYKPAIVLGKRETSHIRQPIALIGKVFCKVDAEFGAIEIGDLLTTSPTPGHAMVVSDRARAFGTTIGKALRQLPAGRGLIPILVALQ